ncbi:MAG: hypothetical protein K8J31_07365 [Anaerolineae bacterium]|nr:hypothetical protein [Anaerolineae bacterium]
MDETRKKIRSEILKLVEEGDRIIEAETEKTKDDKSNEESSKKLPVQVTYQRWYTKALPVVKQLLPERYSEFIEQYKIEKRKE